MTDQPDAPSAPQLYLITPVGADPDAFGPHILAVYPSHRRATGKVVAFIDFLEAFLRERGIA